MKVAALLVLLAHGRPRVDGAAAQRRRRRGAASISPDVYGMNGAVPALADELRLPVDRWGGNLFETYNFSLGAANTADAYYFENIADCFDFSTGCDGGNTPYYRAFVGRDVARGTTPLMELPMAGYVAKDGPTDHPFTCGFPQAGQADYDQYDAGCGNGVKGSDGSPEPSTPTNDGVSITPADRTAWISDLRDRGVHLYELGNEPALWDTTHRDIHPAATTYDELWSKSKTLAEAVKAIDPAGQVIGFSEWGWPNYFCSAADVDHPDGYCGDGDNSDRAAHGDVPLVNWLLQHFKAQSDADGRRLLDYVDVHYYPAGRDSADPMDVTRSLWDPSYTDPSSIDTPIRLIPRMHEWVDADDPGTKTALTEYDLLDPSLSGRQNAIIEADSLGIFGREGLDLATFFDEGYGGPVDGAGTDPASPIADAFRIFRDDDGAGDGFGQTSVSATSADQSRLAVYAAQRDDGALTVLVLTKTAGTLTAPLAVSGATPGATTQTYRWTGGAITREADGPLPTSADYPPQSMTLYVVPGPPAGSGAPVDAGATATTAGAASPQPAASGGHPTPATTTTARRCRVPQLRHVTRRTAVRRLSRKGCRFQVRVRYVHARRALRGRIVRSSLRPGLHRAPGARITLYVGRR